MFLSTAKKVLNTLNKWYFEDNCGKQLNNVDDGGEKKSSLETTWSHDDVADWR